MARVVAVTKCDLDPAAAELSANTLVAHLGQPVRIISADDRTGTEDLVKELMALVTVEKARIVTQDPDEVPILRPQSRERFNVSKERDGRFAVEGYRCVSFVEMMDTEMPGARDEIDRRLDRWGISRALRREGIQRGDTMVFGEVELKWDD